MSDQDPTKPDEAKPKKYPFWPDSLNATYENAEKQSAHSGNSRFAWFRRALIAIGKYAGQRIIFAILYVFLFYLLTNPLTQKNDLIKWSIPTIIEFITYTISVYLALRIFEHEKITNLGLKLNRRAFQDFSSGVLISFSFLAIQFLYFWGTGGITIQGFAWQNTTFFNILLNLAATFLIYFLVGWSEELLARGYQLRILSKGFNKFLGVLLSSAIFAFGHRNNPGANPEYLIFTFLVGILMCFAFFRTGQLWLGIGLHAGWDFFADIVFGVTSTTGPQVFHLMNIKYAYLTVSENFFTEILGLIIMGVFIHFFWLHQKPEPLDW
jgi:uncharacterized protein